MWRRKLGRELRAKVVVCTDGKAGHHDRSRDETGRVRLAEQIESAGIGGWEFEQLLLPGGQPPREACLELTARSSGRHLESRAGFRAGLSILSAPAGRSAGGDSQRSRNGRRRSPAHRVHDQRAACFHTRVSGRSRSAAPCKVPVILNVYDGYMSGVNGFDLAIDVEEAFDAIAEMSWQHQSQIREWLPWVGRHDMDVPKSLDEWKQTSRRHFQTHKREVGIEHPGAVEVFTVTAWGAIPTAEQLLADFPCVIESDASRVRLGTGFGAGSHDAHPVGFPGTADAGTAH